MIAFCTKKCTICPSKIQSERQSSRFEAGRSMAWRIFHGYNVKNERSWILMKIDIFKTSAARRTRGHRRYNGEVFYKSKVYRDTILNFSIGCRSWRNHSSMEWTTWDDEERLGTEERRTARSIEKIILRRSQLRKDDFYKYGFTDGCRSCNAIITSENTADAGATWMENGKKVGSGGKCCCEEQEERWEPKEKEGNESGEMREERRTMWRKMRLNSLQRE